MTTYEQYLDRTEVELVKLNYHISYIKLRTQRYIAHFSEKVQKKVLKFKT